MDEVIGQPKPFRDFSEGASGFTEDCGTYDNEDTKDTAHKAAEEKKKDGECLIKVKDLNTSMPPELDEW